MKIKFKRDTSFRKTLFTADHFAHPAKMDAQLLIWIVERYTKVGEAILDPMAGSGTTMLACTIGRNVVLVELEQKFVGMQEANWDKVRMMPQLGYEMGDCKILQGDARNLEGLVDGIITSPPFAGNKGGLKSAEGFMYGDDNVGKRMMGGIKGGTGDNPANIDNLPYGSIDSVITSPPFSEAKFDKKHGLKELSSEGMKGRKAWANREDNNPTNPENIANKPYGNIDSIITSPPYEERHSYPDAERERRAVAKLKAHPNSKIGGVRIHEHESDNPENIGNMRGDTYLSAMLQVYQQCHKVLKPQGLMILVTKNFIRNKKEVKLDEDTIKLCEQAGFQFVERHYRKLTSQSFWRVIYKQKYPEAPVLDKEDILVFQRELA